MNADSVSRLPSSLPRPRIALVHEWLATYAGSERVLEQMLNIFPDADLFAVVDFVKKEERQFIHNKPVTTTFIQKLPFARKHFRSYLPLMPFAIEQLDVSAYDVIISSNHAVAKGILTGPDQLHICMCYSPIRYAWDLQEQYLRESNMQKGFKSWIVRYLLHRIRLWDYRSAQNVDRFIGISDFIVRRIQKLYGRDAARIYPPVDLGGFTLREDKEDFYLIASRMVPYKKIPLVAEAFAQMPDKKLVIIGDGEQMSQVKAVASPNTKILGYQPFEVLKDRLQRAKAFVFPAKEDFGIAPLEAQACGTPVLAYRAGGAAETIRGLDHAKPSGVFFDAQTPEAIVQAVKTFEANQDAITAQACRENAMRFSHEVFAKEFTELVRKEWTAFHHRNHGEATTPAPLWPEESQRKSA